MFNQGVATPIQIVHTSVTAVQTAANGQNVIFAAVNGQTDGQDPGRVRYDTYGSRHPLINYTH